jgi:hypothetical protein
MQDLKKLNNHKQEQQLDRTELQYCKSCGSVLLKYVDFNNNETTDICINCKCMEPTDKNIVNATPYIFDKYGINDAIPKVSNATEDKLNIFYTSSGKPSSEQIQIHYNPKFKEEVESILDKEIEKTPTQVKENINITKQPGKIIIDWSKIIGYEEIKKIITAALNSTHKKRIHILLCGAPGTSKTVFLLEILKSLKAQDKNAHYLDATTLSSAGVIEYMFSNDMEYCLLDELDKLKKEHQATFLNCFETGKLQETKGSISKNNPKIRQKDMSKCTFIVTANYQDKILKPLFTRMLTLLIPEYTKEQFYQIGVQLLTEQYNKTRDIAFYIVDSIYKIYTETRKEKPNLRYCRDVAILTDNNKSNIEPILQGITTYSRKYEE